MSNKMTDKTIDRLQRCKRNLELGKVIGAVSEEGADERIEAYDLAIKAVKIVNLIEETFKEYPDRMIDIDDWGEIKEEIENGY